MSSRSCSLRSTFEREKGICQPESMEATSCCDCSKQIDNTNHHYEQIPETLNTRQDIVQAIRRILGTNREKRSLKYFRRQSNRFKRPRLSEVLIISVFVSLLGILNSNTLYCFLDKRFCYFYSFYFIYFFTPKNPEI